MIGLRERVMLSMVIIGYMAGCNGGKSMQYDIVDKESVSEILRSSVILLIRVEDLTFGPWRKEEQSDLMAREVPMRIVVEQVLKGTVSQKIGQPFELTVWQRGTGSFRVMDYYGLWSHVALTRGAQFVAFCTGASRDAAALLMDDSCEQLVDPTTALADVKAAIELEQQSLTTGDLIRRGTELAVQRGAILARYVWARTRSYTLKEFDVFESIVRIIEASHTTAQSREAYLTLINEDLGLQDPALTQWETRTILMMFRLLTIPEAEAVRGPIKEIYLPNMLGLQAEAARYSADDIFKGLESERQKALAVLSEVIETEVQVALIQWLKGNTASHGSRQPANP